MFSFADGDSSAKISGQSCQAIRDLVYDDVTAVMIYRLSTSSYTNVQKLLKTYLNSETAHILLLIVNMADVTKAIVNHLRIMVEEAENQNQSQNSNQKPSSIKLFVLLVHFPSSKFMYPCYPTLYLRGWNHYYLDTIGHKIDSGVIDTKEWFSYCCFPSNAYTGDDSLFQTTKCLIEESIDVITSRVPFGSYTGFPFNGDLSFSERKRLLHDLLITKEVGVVMCKLFRSYWRPNVMSRYLEQAANLAHQNQSTRNITDTIHGAIRATFMDFMVIMVSRINENCNLDSLFVSGGSPERDKLFREILAVYPIPPLEQLRVLCNNLPPPRNVGFIPVFPFFNLAMNNMDQMVEECRRELHEDSDILENVAMVHSPSLQIGIGKEFSDLYHRMMAVIQEILKVCIMYKIMPKIN